MTVNTFFLFIQSPSSPSSFDFKLGCDRNSIAEENAKELLPFSWRGHLRHIWRHISKNIPCHVWVKSKGTQLTMRIDELSLWNLRHGLHYCRNLQRYHRSYTVTYKEDMSQVHRATSDDSSSMLSCVRSVYIKNEFVECWKCQFAKTCMVMELENEYRTEWRCTKFFLPNKQTKNS